MLGQPCKVCGKSVDMPTGALCRICHNSKKRELHKTSQLRLNRPCKNCGAIRNLPGKALCKTCYKALRKEQRKTNQSYLDKPCKNCGSPRFITGNALCKTCYNKKQKEYKETWPRYQLYKQKEYWTTYPKLCKACKTKYEAVNKTSKLCPSCYTRYLDIKTAYTAKGKYNVLRNKDQRIFEHRYLAEEIIGRKLTKNEIIHHLDENPQNNKLENLLLFSTNSNHLRLHRYLEVQQVIEEKQGNPKPWSELILPLSLQWLRDNEIPYLRLSELKAFKDQLLKRPRIASQPDLVQRILEERIQWRLYSGSFKITAEIPDSLFKADVT